jgi:hypothetical protein
MQYASVNAEQTQANAPRIKYGMEKGERRASTLRAGRLHRGEEGSVRYHHDRWA